MTDNLLPATKRELFSEPSKTYKNRDNAMQVINGLEEGNYHWLIATTEEGRFFPVVLLNDNFNSMHYFFEKGCCVKI